MNAIGILGLATNTRVFDRVNERKQKVDPCAFENVSVDHKVAIASSRGRIQKPNFPSNEEEQWLNGT